MAPVRNLKSNKDEEGTVYMDRSLSQKVKQAMFDYDLKFAELARRAISYYIDHVLPTLYQRKQSINRGNLPANSESLPVNGSPFGLDTERMKRAMQVLELMEAMKEGK